MVPGPFLSLQPILVVPPDVPCPVSISGTWGSMVCVLLQSLTSLPTLQQMIDPPAAKLLRGAQRRFAQVLHHHRWCQVRDAAAAASPREETRIVAVAQPCCNDYLNSWRQRLHTPTQHAGRVGRRAMPRAPRARSPLIHPDLPAQPPPAGYRPLRRCPRDWRRSLGRSRAAARAAAAATAP